MNESERLTLEHKDEILHRVQELMAELHAAVDKCKGDGDLVDEVMKDHKRIFTYEATGIDAILLEVLDTFTQYAPEEVKNSMRHKVFVDGVMRTNNFVMREMMEKTIMEGLGKRFDEIMPEIAEKIKEAIKEKENESLH